MTVELRETAVISEAAAADAKRSGKMLVQFISPGWGSSGFYSPDVLQEAAANRVIPAGTHMYADHPTKEDRQKRPERSIRDLMAVTTSDAQVTESGALVGEVRVLAPYQQLIEDLKDHIGVSILGDATDIYEGEADGRKGRIIAGLDKVHSVDFVTRAGRGGQVLQILESAGAEEIPGLTEDESVEVLPDAWLTDGIHVELAEALEEIATSAAGAKGDAKLHAYWSHGEGAAKIRWGVAGDFDRCVRHLGKYIADPEGYCAKMHKTVTGAVPGHAPGEIHASDDTPVTADLEESGRVYHWKHGWIPLDHEDAGGRDGLKMGQDTPHGTIVGFKGDKVMIKGNPRPGSPQTLPTREVPLEDVKKAVAARRKRRLTGAKESAVAERDFSGQQRKSMADKGTAMSDGSFPIANTSDLRNAITALGRAKDPEAAKRHIIARARKLGAVGSLPDSWGVKESEAVEHYTGRISEDGHKVYRYKHGWIPLGHTDADQAVAKLSLSQRQSYANHRSSGMSHEEALQALVKGHEEDLKTAQKMGYKKGTSVHNNHSDMLKGARKALGDHQRSKSSPGPKGDRSFGGPNNPTGNPAEAPNRGAAELEQAEQDLKTLQSSLSRAKTARSGTAMHARQDELKQAVKDARARLKKAQAAAHESNVPATRPDTPNTHIEETEMGKIQIEESDYDRLVEAAGRVESLEAQLETFQSQLAEATKPVEEGTKPTRRTSHTVVVETLEEQKHEIATLKARERARDIVAEEMTEAWVAPSTVARLTTELLADLPLVEEKLDEIGLRNRCVEARDRAELEAAETLDAAGFGRPTGLGASTPPAGGDANRYADTITESLKTLGLSEAAADAAVKGR